MSVAVTSFIDAVYGSVRKREVLGSGLATEWFADVETTDSQHLEIGLPFGRLKHSNRLGRWNEAL